MDSLNAIDLFRNELYTRLQGFSLIPDDGGITLIHHKRWCRIPISLPNLKEITTLASTHVIECDKNFPNEQEITVK